MTNKKISNVKEHYKYLRDGKKHLWREHIRVDYGYATEVDTEEHKIFVNSFIDILLLSNIKEYNTEVMVGDKRRCDVLIHMNNGRKLCVECQLSKISRNDLYDRTFYYLHNGYEVKWILPVNYKEYIYTRLVRYCEHLGYSCYIRELSVGIDYTIFHKKLVFDKHKVKIGN